MVQRACLARLQACIASACATLPRLRSLQPPAGMQRIHSTKCRHTRRPRRCHALAGYRVLLPGVGLPTSVTKSGLGNAPWAIKVCSSQGSRRVQGGCCGDGGHQLETAPCKRSGAVKQTELAANPAFMAPARNPSIGSCPHLVFQNQDLCIHAVLHQRQQGFREAARCGKEQHGIRPAPAAAPAWVCVQATFSEPPSWCP